MISRLAQWLALRLVGALGSHDKAGPVKRKLGALFLEYFPGQITCREFESFVYDYYENQLPEDKRELFEFHMRICPMCKSAFMAYVRTVELTGLVFEKPANDGVVSCDEALQELVNVMLVARRGRG